VVLAIKTWQPMVYAITSEGASIKRVELVGEDIIFWDWEDLII
jgi:hypothetical protein